MSNTSMFFEGLRLLIVDDDFDTRTLLTFLFELEGAEVITSASAGEALEAMSSFKPDILISDICLPDEDGYSLLRKVRKLELKLGGNIPAIAITASGNEENCIRSFLAGFQRHVCKPIDLEELSAVVTSLVGLQQCA